MRDAWIECVPNVSEGRRSEVIAALSQRLEGLEGVYVLHRDADRDHNRCVFTFVARPWMVREAGLALMEEAIRQIDLRRHDGVHPRMGALDVFPLIPLQGVSVAECVRLSEELGEAFAETFELPVYLYEHTAGHPARRRLAGVRRSGPLEPGGERVASFEYLRHHIADDPALHPDYGPTRLHPSAGAVAVGCRFFLLAYNINLASDDLRLAQQIAKTIRERAGGFRGVRALGFSLAEQGCVQVSMNLTDYRHTGLETVYREVAAQASAAGVEVRESELIGLLPEDAVLRAFRGFAHLGELAESYLFTDDAEACLSAPPQRPAFVARWPLHRPGEEPWWTTLEVAQAEEVAPRIEATLAELHEQAASEAGAELGEGELVAPLAASVVRCAVGRFLRLPGFDAQRVIEPCMRKVTGGPPFGTLLPADPLAQLDEFVREVASPVPGPGSAAVAAVTATLAAALGEMAAELAWQRDQGEGLPALLARLRSTRLGLLATAEQDALAADRLRRMRRRRKETPEGYRTALCDALLLPEELAAGLAELIEVLEALAPYLPGEEPFAGRAEQSTALWLCRAVLESVEQQVRRNVAELAALTPQDPQGQAAEQRLTTRLAELRERLIRLGCE